MQALGVAEASVSLDQPAGEHGELSDLFADEAAEDPFEAAVDAMRHAGVRRGLAALPERERRVLELRFGFDGDERTLAEVGRELGLTRERARKLETRALKRLELWPDAWSG